MSSAKSHAVTTSNTLSGGNAQNLFLENAHNIGPIGPIEQKIDCKIYYIIQAQ